MCTISTYARLVGEKVLVNRYVKHLNELPEHVETGVLPLILDGHKVTSFNSYYFCGLFPC